jgi:hypothetical protein
VVSITPATLFAKSSRNPLYDRSSPSLDNVCHISSFSGQTPGRQKRLVSNNMSSSLSIKARSSSNELSSSSFQRPGSFTQSFRSPANILCPEVLRLFPKNTYKPYYVLLSRIQKTQSNIRMEDLVRGLRTSTTPSRKGPLVHLRTLLLFYPKE